MGESDRSQRIARVDFVPDVPKARAPEPGEDFATVDFDARRKRVVVLGWIRNGDSRHSLELDAVALVEEAGRDRLRAAVRLVESDDQIVFDVERPQFHYRLEVEFAGSIPGEYVVEHVDEADETLYEVREVLLVQPAEYRRRQREE